MNKKAWINVAEAAISLLLVAGVLIAVLSSNYRESESLSGRIYESEISILREIQLNENLREKILLATPLPVNWTDFNSSGMGNVKNKINAQIPNYLNCEAKLCEIDKVCNSDSQISKDIYVQSVIISSNSEYYRPRQLRLFCWERS